MTSTLNQQVDQIITAAFVECGIPLPKSGSCRSFITSRHGFDRQCNDIMAVAKQAGADPRVLAARIEEKLHQSHMFSAIQVAGPGFINLRLNDDIVMLHAQVPMLVAEQHKRFIIDYGGPNIAKALHVGHLRSLVIGESLRRILTYRQHDVISDIHFGDWGQPVGMMVAEIERNKNIPLTSEMLEQMYPAVVQACKDDPERAAEARRITIELQNGQHVRTYQILRQISLRAIMDQITTRLDIHFNLLMGESDSQPYVESVLDLIPHRVEEEGAIVIDVALPTDTKELKPIVYRTSDGAYTYSATDLATIFQRHKLADTILYVVDNRQADHFERVFRASRAFCQTDLQFIGFGTINGADGKPYKTRDGDVPTLDSMLNAAIEKVSERISDRVNAELIAIGAIKFADLITDRNSGYVFDLDRMLSLEGKTGPYVQYAAVRINSIFKRASPPDNTTITITCPEERELLVACANFAEMIGLAETQMSPTFVAEYVFGVAQKFSQFYGLKIIDPPDDPTGGIQASRLMICKTTLNVISQCLDMLGIEIPSAM